MGFIIAVSRIALPFITITLLIKCVLTLWLGHPREKTYGYIVDMHSGTRHELNMWETSIGRSNSCDIVLNYDSVARSHVVITRRIDGWYIFDVTANKTPIKINGETVQKKQTVTAGDIITLGKAKFRFEVIDDPVQKIGKPKKVKTKKKKSSQPVQQKSKNVDLTENSTQQKKVVSVQHCIVNKDTNETFILWGAQTQTYVTIGTARQSDIKLKSSQAARKHAVISLFDDGWAIENLSGADTYLNGHKVTSPLLLRDGDVIALADERLYFIVRTKTIS